jgi:LysR family transcriptional regulator, glycine cleavage system transcriptional activator
MNDLPPLKSLRVFESCIRLGSFTRAARELNVGQPAISHQIHALESDLGIKLFERRGSQTLPTADALVYYRSIAGALADMARASATLRRGKRPPGLTLATYPGIAMFWVMPRLSKVKQIHPGLVIKVITAERDRDMALEDVDCAILFGDGSWPGYESRRLMREVVVPVAAPAVAARLAGRSRTAILQKGPLIHLEDQDRRWFTWTDWRDQRSPETQDIDAGITVTNHGIAIHQTLMGHGIALGWSGVIDEMIENRLLVALDPEPLSSERGYYLVATTEFLNTRIGKLVLQAAASRTGTAE